MNIKAGGWSNIVFQKLALKFALKVLWKTMMPPPSFEPGSAGWKSAILASRPVGAFIKGETNLTSLNF